MNIIKARTKNGRDVTLKIRKNSPKHAGISMHNTDWQSSSAAVKAHATFIMGLILTGKRQAQS